jgi:signal transduction histidine kinase/ligand-binding sensor domain-containing protein/DNA-binding response OmpR family regulator
MVFIRPGLLLLALALFLAPAAAQHAAAEAFNPRFERFELPGGVSANNVQAIVQDERGYLWFGSNAGLHRYDGKYFRTYRHDPFNANSLAFKQVEWISLDRRGRLWLAHYGGGFTCFDPVTERFTRYRHEAADAASLLNNVVSCIVEDRDGYIWIGTAEGLDRLDPATGSFRHFRHEPSDPRSLSYSVVRALYVDRQGTLWVGTGFPWSEPSSTGFGRGGLNRYDPRTESFTRFEHEAGNPASLSNNYVRALYEDTHGNFWVGTAGRDGLHRLDRATGRFERLRFDPAAPQRLSAPVLQRHVSPEGARAVAQVAFISEDQAGRLWVGAFNGGINVYDPSTGVTRHFESPLVEGDTSNNQYFWQFCQTRDGVIWIATADAGGQVFKLSFPRQQLRTVGNTALGLKKLTISALLEDRAGRLWLKNTPGSPDLMRYDPASGGVQSFRLGLEQLPVSYPHVNALVEDRRGRIWVGGENGLFCLDPVSGQIRQFRHDPGDPQSLADNRIWALLEDAQGSIWIGAGADALNRLDPGTGEMRRFPRRPDVQLDLTSYISTLYEDRAGNLWVGGGRYNDEAMFLDRFDRGTHAFEPFIGPTTYGLPLDVCEDERGDLWFYKLNDGIWKLEPGSRRITRFTEANSVLPTDELRALLGWRRGKLWLTTASSLLEFDPGADLLRVYSGANGEHLPSLAYGAGLIARNGDVLAGGEKGFHRLAPDDAAATRPDAVRARLHLTEFRLADQPVAPGSSILPRPLDSTGVIRLAYNQDVFSFGIACFDFYQPEAIFIEYLLENYDAGWRTDLRDGAAHYVKIPPGEYVLRVRGANSTGMWSGESISVRVVVAPPWWRSAWFYALAGALLAGGLWFVYRFQLNRRLARAEAARLLELDGVKTRLYTQITHEFRTPLTVILGMTGQILEDPAKNAVPAARMIERNGHSMLRLVNQLLDLARLESGKLVLHWVQGDVMAYLRYLLESFHSLAGRKQIRLHFLGDGEALLMDYDAERLQQVVSNLLSNAIKFTPEGGHIYLSARRLGDGLAAQLEIRVKDTGIGIAEENLPHIFERFYQGAAAHAHTGSGIGLAFTRELVRLMGGDVTVKSRPGQGSEFIVALPIHCEAELLTGEAGSGAEPADEAAGRSLERREFGPAVDDTAVRLLLVEDNADVVTYLAACLPDYQLAIARDGEEGLEIAVDRVPDLIITDVMMPRRDGFELTRALKADPRTSHVPVIMLTARADLRSKLEGLGLGAEAYLEKPFHKEELRLRVRKLLELRHSLQRHYLAAALSAPAEAERDIPALDPGENAFVQQARAVVEAHLDDAAFDVETLSRELHLSPSQVHRKLTALTGLPAHRFIRYVRLNKAKDLLQNPECSVTAVAFDTGFNDPSYFGRVFKQEFGVTPQEWRAKR